MKHISFTLPIEIWELILDLLDTKSLLNFQDSCHTYRNIILDYVIRGRIRDRALVRIKIMNFKLSILSTNWLYFDSIFSSILIMKI